MRLIARISNGRGMNREGERLLLPLAPNHLFVLGTIIPQKATRMSPECTIAG
jgi:hypothetical protein